MTVMIIFDKIWMKKSRRYRYAAKIAWKDERKSWSIIKVMVYVCVCVCMYVYVYVCVYIYIYIYIYRVSQEERTKLRESVPYVKLYRYNPKHLYPS